jgi:hypothetical protein
MELIRFLSLLLIKNEVELVRTLRTTENYNPNLSLIAPVRRESWVCGGGGVSTQKEEGLNTIFCGESSH